MEPKRLVSLASKVKLLFKGFPLELKPLCDLRIGPLI